MAAWSHITAALVFVLFHGGGISVILAQKYSVSTINFACAAPCSQYFSTDVQRIKTDKIKEVWAQRNRTKNIFNGGISAFYMLIWSRVSNVSKSTWNMLAQNLSWIAQHSYILIMGALCIHWNSTDKNLSPSYQRLVGQNKTSFKWDAWKKEKHLPTRAQELYHSHFFLQ